MKRALLVLAGVAMAASLATADVVSKNVVGYYTVKLNYQGYSMIGINWNSIDGTGIPLQELFPEGTLYPGEGEWDLDNCDQIALWDNDLQGYIVFYFLDIGEGAKWYDETFVETDFVVTPGAAFWFYRPSDQGSEYVQIAGQVDERSSIDFVFKQGYSAFSKGYPVEKLVGEEIEGYPGEGEWDLDNCDNIAIWDNELMGYVSYYYFDAGEGPAWHDETFVPVSDNFVVGAAGWYFRQAPEDLEWTETSPL